jgi:hypothetical protein
MMNNITIIQIFTLFIVNIIGIFLMYLVFYVFRKPKIIDEKKLFTSLFLGMISVSLLFIVSLDIGIYLWVSSNKINLFIAVIPFYICSAPIFFLISSAGAYIQLLYRSIFMDWIYGNKKRM